MSNNAHRFVIDRNGFYVTFVLPVERSGGKAVHYEYTMKSGEPLIEASLPSNMIIPCWTSPEWEETGVLNRI